MVSSCLPVLSFIVNTGWITVPPMGKIWKNSFLCVRFFFSVWGSFLVLVVLGFFVWFFFFVAVLLRACTLIFCSNMSKIGLSNFFHLYVFLFFFFNYLFEGYHSSSASCFFLCIVSHLVSLWLGNASEFLPGYQFGALGIRSLQHLPSLLIFSSHYNSLSLCSSSPRSFSMTH